MSHYGSDMDYDGEITTKDCGMFHEMTEEDEKAYAGKSYYGSSEPWTVYHSFAKGLLLLLFGGYMRTPLREITSTGQIEQRFR